VQQIPLYIFSIIFPSKLCAHQSQVTPFFVIWALIKDQNFYLLKSQVFGNKNFFSNQTTFQLRALLDQIYITKIDFPIELGGLLEHNLCFRQNIG
jgi:hypothetical protein